MSTSFKCVTLAYMIIAICRLTFLLLYFGVVFAVTFIVLNFNCNLLLPPYGTFLNLLFTFFFFFERKPILFIDDDNYNYTTRGAYSLDLEYIYINPHREHPQ